MLVPALLVVMLLGTAVPTRAAEPVRRVEIRISFEGGEPHPLVVRRVAETIAAAGERLLVGREIELVARQETALAGVLRDVVNRVVWGYTVAAIRFSAGAVTAVSVALQPRHPVLGELPVTFAYQGIHPEARPLVAAVLEPSIPQMRGLLVRLPLDALEWALPVVESRARELVEAAAPGFTAAARLSGDPPGALAVSVTAKDPLVIRDIGVRFRSSSVPLLLLDGHTPQAISMAEPLRGLPVAFAAAHRAKLEAMIAERLKAYPPAIEYGIVARPTLRVAEQTNLTLLAESTLYRARLEARLNFGADAPPADVRAQVGRAFGSLEPFVEMTLVPSSLAWRWALGVRLELGTHLSVGVLSRLSGEGAEPFIVYRLSPDLTLRGAYSPQSGEIEGAVTYRMNEFLSWEAVGTSRGYVWLRMVSNL